MGVLVVLVLPQIIAVVLSSRVAVRLQRAWLAFLAGSLLTLLLAGLFGFVFGWIVDQVAPVRGQFIFSPMWQLGPAANLELGLFTGPVVGIVAAVIVFIRERRTPAKVDATPDQPQRPQSEG